MLMTPRSKFSVQTLFLEFRLVCPPVLEAVLALLFPLCPTFNLSSNSVMPASRLVHILTTCHCGYRRRAPGEAKGGPRLSVGPRSLSPQRKDLRVRQKDSVKHSDFIEAEGHTQEGSDANPRTRHPVESG